MLEIISDYKYLITKEQNNKTSIWCTNSCFIAPENIGRRTKIHYYPNYGSAYKAAKEMFRIEPFSIIKVKVTTEQVEDDSKYLENQMKKKSKEEQEKLEREATKTVIRNDLYELGILNDDGSIKDEYKTFFIEQLRRY